MEERKAGSSRSRLFALSALIGIIIIAIVVIIFVASPFSDSGEEENESSSTAASSFEEVVISTAPQQDLPAMPEGTELEEIPSEWENPAQGGTFTIPAILRFIEGDVTVERDEGMIDGYDMMKLYPRDFLQIQEDTTVTIHFFEGSVSVLEGPTEVTLTASEVSGTAGDAYADIEIQLDAGNVINKVGGLFTGHSSHKVSTANTVAGAWGTIYQVIVSEEGVTECKVSEGTIKTAYIAMDAEGKSSALVTVLKAEINNTIRVPAIKPDLLPIVAKKLNLPDQDIPTIRKHLISLLRQKVALVRDTGDLQPTSTEPTSPEPTSTIPHQIQGSVTINGEPAPDGTVIKAFIGSTEIKSVKTVGARYSIELNSRYLLRDVTLTVNYIEAKTVNYQITSEGNIDLAITIKTPEPTETGSSIEQPLETTDIGDIVISQPSPSPTSEPEITPPPLPGKIIYVAGSKEGLRNIRKGPDTQELIYLQPEKEYWIYSEQEIFFASLPMNPGWNFIIWRDYQNTQSTSETMNTSSIETNLTPIEEVIEDCANVPVIVLHLDKDKSTPYLYKSPPVGDIPQIEREQGYYVHANWADPSQLIYLSGAELMAVDPCFEN
ncbi:MAG: hypothetical protein R6U37_01025 [Dehalococcoidia bacterium]